MTVNQGKVREKSGKFYSRFGYEPCHFRSFQIVSGRFRSFQVVSGRFRSFQVVSGRLACFNCYQLP